MVTVDPAARLAPQEFLVAVAAEPFGQASSIRAELLKRLNDALGGQCPDAVKPDVLGGMVD